MRSTIGFFLFLALFPPAGHAEFRSAKDMQKECRVALDVLHNHVENTGENMFFAGECIGFVQGAVDATMALTENVEWYKICVPEDISTEILIRQFILFVDKYPKYTLASTAIQMMLAQEYACAASPKKKPSN
ncbi:MAG TPA: Rap1a/Tai family immunity protein [Candidatus Dormibacteraeota bacterium]|nr:Rap1a/Tai family immunity protein [Candidatus Dormibacteraeota bacterium]